MDLETGSAVGSEALMTVLQDWMSGGQTHPWQLPQHFILCMQVPSPIPHWYWVLRGEQSSWTSLRFIPFLFIGCSPQHLVSPCPVHLFPLLCFEFTARMSPPPTPKHSTLPLFAQTFPLCNLLSCYINKLSLKASYHWKWTTLSFYF